MLQVLWNSGIGDAPPAVVPYLAYPWVVANDRIKDAGWVPRHTQRGSNSARVATAGEEPAAPDRRGRGRVVGRGDCDLVGYAPPSRWFVAQSSQSCVKYFTRTFLYSLIDQSKQYSSMPVSVRIASIVASQSRALRPCTIVNTL